MPVAVVQETELQQTTASATWSLNFASAVTAGNVVVLIARLLTANRTPNTPTTSGSGTLASVVQSGSTTANGALWMWSAIEAGSGNTTYSLTIASSLASAGVFQAYELSGAGSATATSSDANVAQASSTSPRMTTASGLTIASGGIMIGAISVAPSAVWGTLTDPANFNRDLNTGSFLAAHSTTAASGVTGTATITTARAVNGLAATWIEAATGQPMAKRWGGVPHNGFRRRGMW